MVQIKDILVKPCGEYQTNCYIIKFDSFDIVIDPGVGAFEWIKTKSNNIEAILNTHGHFDHVWDNRLIKEHFDAVLYTPKDDAFMLKDDIFGLNLPISTPDVLVKPNAKISINKVSIIFHHFPGHTPGCSAVEIENNLFSGDFIFKNSIGRVDFPYSNPNDMKKSLEKILKWDRDVTIFPGHGEKTNFFKEKSSLKAWFKYL